MNGCDDPTHSSIIDLGTLPPHSAVTQPISLCITLDPKTAVAGIYNLLISVVYQWDQGSDLVTAEKNLQVDLIGTETIVGIPIGFAGFVLPGLMLLVALKWFGVPWATSLQTEDRIIYGVILSLVLLGPFSWMAGQPGIPQWVTWLDFQKQVSIERLGIYILVGVLIGTLIGLFYKSVEIKKMRDVKFKESMQIIEGDQAPGLLIKALMLNSKYRAKKVFFQNKTSRVYGYHYARSGNSIYIFAHFILILSRLKPDTRKKIRSLIDSEKGTETNPQGILAILKLLGNEDAKAFIIAIPVIEVATVGKSNPINPNQAYLRIDGDQYLQPQYEENLEGSLLEIMDEEPY
jgi:hypothetical protein